MDASARAAPAPPPGPQEVDAIAGLHDPVVRNLQITQCYHELSLYFQARAGGANWCTFATWASKQAGQTIRGEDLMRAFERKVNVPSRVSEPFQSLWRKLLRSGLHDPGSRLGRLAREIHSPFDAFERASDAVARGNRKVFEEIGREFARFLAVIGGDSTEKPQELARFLDGLRPGDPPEGQGYLRRAFARYSEALSEPDDGRRAQLICLANLEIGFHEQTRLQPEIRDALEAPAREAHDFKARLLTALFPGSVKWWRAVRGPLSGLLAVAARRLQRHARKLARAAITERLMTLTLPGPLILQLGRDLDAVPAAALAKITLPELANMLARVEGPSGAGDWAELSERMRFIARLFRCFHDRQEMLEPPFSNVQVEQFKDGSLPDGEL
jgi:hypothetical protein